MALQAANRRATAVPGLSSEPAAFFGTENALQTLVQYVQYLSRDRMPGRRTTSLACPRSLNRWSDRLQSGAWRGSIKLKCRDPSAIPLLGEGETLDPPPPPRTLRRARGPAPASRGEVLARGRLAVRGVSRRRTGESSATSPGSTNSSGSTGCGWRPAWFWPARATQPWAGTVWAPAQPGRCAGVPDEVRGELRRPPVRAAVIRDGRGQPEQHGSWATWRWGTAGTTPTTGSRTRRDTVSPRTNST